jgi:squalene-associated FAD-dependent desaturase
MTASDRADVVVIGGGFAGLSAAVRLAAAGRRVVVVEQAPRLGGRATSFVDRETGERVDNGQHALFGCYRETYAFLGSIGASHLAPLQPTLTLAMADRKGRVSTLTCPRLPAPWHLIAGLMRWPAIGLADRASALRLIGLLRRVRRDGAAVAAADVPAALTVSEWLRAHGQSRTLCDWLWDPLAIAALNQQPGVAAAAPFVRVLGELFAPNPAASAIGLPVVALDDLYGPPSAAFLEARGGCVMLKAPATIAIDSAGRVAGVQTGDRTIGASCVVSAVPWHAFGAIWNGQPPAVLSAIAGAAASMRSSPIVTVNLWLDGPASNATDAPFVGLVGGPMHWVFNRSAILGGTVDHLSVVASGADDLTRMDSEAITAVAMDQLRLALPSIGARKMRRSVVVREHRATFSLAPGGPARPGAATPLAGFVLAGDWTDTGLPGTIEGAVQSGHAAARVITSNF